MKNPLFDATVKDTGRKIRVYKLKKGGYCEYPGCSNEFQKEELEVGKESAKQE
jgi:hypothetical protein